MPTAGRPTHQLHYRVAAQLEPALAGALPLGAGAGRKYQEPTARKPRQGMIADAKLLGVRRALCGGGALELCSHRPASGVSPAGARMSYRLRRD